MLIYMDTVFVPHTNKTAINELCLNLWRDNIIHSDNIHLRLRKTLCDLILIERNGDEINGGLMRKTIKMLMDLGSSVYQQDFEKPFLAASADFYGVKSQQLIDHHGCGDYLKKAEKCIIEETERVSHYLDPKSVPKIKKVVEREMISNHMSKLVHMKKSGLANMILHEKYEDLGRMYDLFRRVENGLDTIQNGLSSHIRETGKQLVIDQGKEKYPVEFVQRLLDEKDKYDNIISIAYKNDRTLMDVLNSSFRYLINLNPQSAELVLLFVDDELGSLKGVSEEDVDVMLDKVIMLFRYLEDKGAFEKYYRQHLVKRLLSGNTCKAAERRLIVKLKRECGNDFTSKLESLFTDMASQTTVGSGPKLTVQVVNTAS